MPRWDGVMKIDDVDGARELFCVGLGRTESEGRELRDKLDHLVQDPIDTHEHASSADFQIELTVWIKPAA